MKEYRSRREQKYIKQIAFYGVVLIGLVIFMATVGVNLLIKSTLFFTSLGNKGVDSTNQAAIFGQPQFFDLPNATNSAFLVLHGQGTQKKNLTIFVNDDVQKELVLDEDEFETEVTLQKGENTIYAILEDEKTKNRVKSDTYTVFYGSEKPTLEISEPASGYKTDKEEVTIAGTTQTEAVVRVNGSPTVVESDGKFNQSVRLTVGENKIQITATDRAGNTETKEIVVIYEKD